MSIATLAKTASDAMVSTKRDNGEEFWKFTDTAPAWCKDLSHACHGDMLPDDYRYSFIRDALLILADCEDEDEWSQRIDSDVDIYTHALCAWLGSYAGRIGYVDEAVEEMGLDKKRGIIGALMMGQYREREEVLQAAVAFLRDMDDDSGDQPAEDAA